MVHCTDLFRPHNDPDDHWDLASVFALAHGGHIDLKAVLCDFPVPRRANDPDIMAVAQLNYLTGLAVPLVVGAPEKSLSGDAPGNADSARATGGIRQLLTILRESSEPVVINVIGSCRDIALAGRLAPDLFAKKCAGIYLNAGSGTPDKAKAERLEYNVSLDPAAYAAIFDLPCPIYWMPCFEEINPADKKAMWSVRQYGTLYRFQHADVMPHLPVRLRQYFTFMYRAGGNRTEPHNTTDWLRYLLGPEDNVQQQRVSETYRNMWCTAGFLHAAGMTVAQDGEIAPLEGEAAGNAVFTFDPIRVTCSPEGVTEWQFDRQGTDRYIFHVRDREHYQRAMTRALIQLLGRLP
jgi:hypothetical protein